MALSCPGRSSRYLMTMRVGGSERRSGVMEKIKVYCPYRDSNYNFSGRAACSHITVLTTGIDNRTANCTLHHVVLRLYTGVLNFNNITSFYGTSLYVI
jgi:hypothetical protein